MKETILFNVHLMDTRVNRLPLYTIVTHTLPSFTRLVSYEEGNESFDFVSYKSAPDEKFIFFALRKLFTRTIWGGKSTPAKNTSSNNTSVRLLVFSEKRLIQSKSLSLLSTNGVLFAQPVIMSSCVKENNRGVCVQVNKGS